MRSIQYLSKLQLKSLFLLMACLLSFSGFAQNFPSHALSLVVPNPVS